MQTICTSLQTDNHTNTSSVNVYTNLDLNKARDDGVLGWQRHQLDHMQTICTSLSRQITTPTPHQSMFTGRMLFQTPIRQCQSAEVRSI